MESALADLDLSLAQYAALHALGTVPGLSSAELARHSFVTPQTMNEVVQQLEAAGRVSRHPHPSHGRIRQVLLTARGRSVLAAATARVRAQEGRMIAGLSPTQQRQFSSWLQACSTNLWGGDPGRSKT